MSDWDTTTYLTKSHAKKGSANEKTQVRQAQRAGTLETRQKMFAGTNNKGNTAHHAKLDRETEELKHKVSMKSTIFGWSGLGEFMNQDILRVHLPAKKQLIPCIDRKNKIAEIFSIIQSF